MNSIFRILLLKGSSDLVSTVKLKCWKMMLAMKGSGFQGLRFDKGVVFKFGQMDLCTKVTGSTAKLMARED